MIAAVVILSVDELRKARKREVENRYRWWRRQVKVERMSRMKRKRS